MTTTVHGEVSRCHRNTSGNGIPSSQTDSFTAKRISPLYHMIASQTASAASTLTFYPFDTLRIRFMSQDGTVQRQHNGQTYRSIARALATMYRAEGLWAIFRGCHVAVLGSVTSWGVYMYLYRLLCSTWELSSYLGKASVSTLASLTAAFVSSPVWLIKSRMQIEDATKTRHYITFRGGFLHIVRTTGFRSLWRGTSLQLILVFPNALNMPTYDFLKGKLLHHHELAGVRRDNLTTLEVVLCSMITKVFLVSLSHPVMLLKIRLQDQRSILGEVKYTDLYHSIRLILKREGCRGLVRGLCTSLAHSLPRSLTQFVLYEKSLSMINRYSEGKGRKGLTH